MGMGIDPLGAPVNPGEQPEAMQMNLPIPGLPEADSPRKRGWITESNRSLALALQESVRRLSNMTDDEYLDHLAIEYEAARKRAMTR